MTALRPEAGRAALIRRMLILALAVGLVLGGLDLARMLSQGDLAPASVHYLVLLLNMAQALAAGLAIAIPLSLLPRRGLVRFVTDLLQLPFPGPRAEAAWLALVLLLAALAGPLAATADQRRLVRTTAEAAGSAPPAAAAPADRPNVILLVLDTVRSDHLSLYGYDRATSPNLERLAPEFLVCRDTISSAPWTVPSHATLFTGLYPAAHGARSFLPRKIPKKFWSNVYSLERGRITLAERLAAAGYLTAGLVSNPFLSRRSGLGQGFHHYLYQPNRNFRLSLHCAWLMNHLFGDRYRAVFDKPQQTAWQINRRIEAWLDRYADRPFFLFANYMDAHMPTHAPPPFCDAFPGRLDGFHFNVPFEAAIMGRERPVSDAEKAHLHAFYDGSIRYLDHHLGLLLDGLRERGLWEKSLILLLSDHGEFFGEHALLEHSKDVYQPAMAVPLMVKFPGGEPAGEVTVRTHLADVMPTILDVAGVVPPDGLPGMDLRQVSGGRRLLGENYFARIKDLERPYGRRFFRVRQAVYQGRWKYIHSTDGNSELYDLETDPDEQKNLIKARPDVAVAMQAWLMEQLESAAADSEGPRPMEVDEETKKRLEALGYI